MTEVQVAHGRCSGGTHECNLPGGENKVRGVSLEVPAQAGQRVESGVLISPTQARPPPFLHTPFSLSLHLGWCLLLLAANRSSAETCPQIKASITVSGEGGREAGRPGPMWRVHGAGKEASLPTPKSQVLPYG